MTALHTGFAQDIATLKALVHGISDDEFDALGPQGQACYEQYAEELAALEGPNTGCPAAYTDYREDCNLADAGIVAEWEALSYSDKHLDAAVDGNKGLRAYLAAKRRLERATAYEREVPAPATPGNRRMNRHEAAWLDGELQYLADLRAAYRAEREPRVRRNLSFLGRQRVARLNAIYGAVLIQHKSRSATNAATRSN